MKFCEPDEHIYDFKNIVDKKIHIDNFDWSVVHKLYPRGVDPRDENAEFKVNSFAMVESCLNCKKERISIYTALSYVYPDNPGWNFYYPQKVTPAKEPNQNKKPKSILQKINMKNISRGINAFNKTIQDFGISMNELSKEFATPKTDDSAKNQKNLEKIWGSKESINKIEPDSSKGTDSQKTKDEINLEKIWGKKNPKKKDFGFNKEDVFDI